MNRHHEQRLGEKLLRIAHGLDGDAHRHASTSPGTAVADEIKRISAALTKLALELAA